MAHQKDLDVQALENANFSRPGATPRRYRLLPVGGTEQRGVMRTHERAGHPTDEVYEIKATV